MKKLLLIMGVCFSLLSCKESTQKQKQLLPPLFTLNGISVADANSLVNNFLNDKKIKSHMTSVLLTKTLFNSMDSLLIKQNADGLRIYFAKNPHGKDTLVIVSTFNGGVDPDGTTKHIHRDFYQRSEHYFNSSLINGMTVNYGAAPGALLFTHPNCPDKDDCDTTKLHYITCKKAYNMVQSFMKPDPGNPGDTINSNSEWFDAQIVHDLNLEVQKTQTSGLRIYFAQCLKPDKMRIRRHAFVLIKTNNSTGTPVDDYFCFTLRLKGPKKNSNEDKGGTDNGEECPTNCSGVTWP